MMFFSNPYALFPPPIDLGKISPLLKRGDMNQSGYRPFAGVEEKCSN